VNAQDASFSKVLEKVLADYPQSFKNVRGELIMEDEEEQRYSSKLELPGAQDCLVSLPMSGERKLAKWEAVCFSSTSFDDAVSNYKKLHDQLLKSTLKLGKSNARLRGDYAIPNADESFTSIIYNISPASAAFRKVKIELELVQVLEEWRVNLRVGSGDFSD
jgi:hypothetical protein